MCTVWATTPYLLENCICCEKCTVGALPPSFSWRASVRSLMCIACATTLSRMTSAGRGLMGATTWATTAYNLTEIPWWIECHQIGRRLPIGWISWPLHRLQIRTQWCKIYYICSEVTNHKPKKTLYFLMILPLDTWTFFHLHRECKRHF